MSRPVYRRLDRHSHYILPPWRVSRSPRSNEWKVQILKWKNEIIIIIIILSCSTYCTPMLKVQVQKIFKRKSLWNYITDLIWSKSVENWRSYDGLKIWNFLTEISFPLQIEPQSKFNVDIIHLVSWYILWIILNSDSKLFVLSIYEIWKLIFVFEQNLNSFVELRNNWSDITVDRKL